MLGLPVAGQPAHILRYPVVGVLQVFVQFAVDRATVMDTAGPATISLQYCNAEVMLRVRLCLSLSPLTHSS